ncbi:MAG: LruC domain-containing protein, partial [Bacteroidales bacterium]
QWPIKGDYDLNDLVVLFRVTSITNSSNQITKLHFDYNLIAAVAIKQLSAGFQLDNVMASNIKSVTGQLLGGGTPFATEISGVETGVAKAIIPLFNGTKAVVSYSGFLNTVPGEYTSTPEKRVTVEFNSPVNQSEITMGSFNFFIVADTRGKEIHTPGYLATEKFNSTFVSGGSLHPSDNFKTADGMMWGLMFPEGFSYPSEKNSIIDAYTHFAAWATSGGNQYPDWYLDKPGYRDQELIY